MSKGKTNKMNSYLILALYVIASSLGMVLIKKGGTTSIINFNKLNFKIQLSWVFIIGIMLYVVSFILWIFILQKFTLTYISPVAYGLTFIFIAIFSYLFLQTTISKSQIVSAALIILGIIIGTISPK